MLAIFKRKRTMSTRDAGRLGAMTKRNREREAFKATIDDMRERLGMDEWEWRK